MTTTYYSRSREGAVPVRCSKYTEAIRSPYMIVRDTPSTRTWELFNEHDVPEYIARSAKIFESRFAEFIEPVHVYNPEEAKELHMMLDALIVAKSLATPSHRVATVYYR